MAALIRVLGPDEGMTRCQRLKGATWKMTADYPQRHASCLMRRRHGGHPDVSVVAVLLLADAEGSSPNLHRGRPRCSSSTSCCVDSCDFVPLFCLLLHVSPRPSWSRSYTRRNISPSRSTSRKPLRCYCLQSRGLAKDSHDYLHGQSISPQR
jgi:hypothetical protein